MYASYAFTKSASIAVPRRRQRAKTDEIDGELTLRALMALIRAEPRVSPWSGCRLLTMKIDAGSHTNANVDQAAHRTYQSHRGIDGVSRIEPMRVKPQGFLSMNCAPR